MSAAPAVGAVFFDFNGVIIDDEPVHLELFRDAVAEFGIEITRELYYERYVGVNDREAFQLALGEAGLGERARDREFIAGLIRRKAARYREVISREPRFFPGAVELVRELERSFPLAIVSGALPGELDLVLRLGGIRDAFTAVVSGEDVTRSKPDPGGYLLGLERLVARLGPGVAPPAAAECLAIEDSPAGVRAARAAGMRCLAVEHSYPAAKLETAGAAPVYRDIAAIPRDLFRR